MMMYLLEPHLQHSSTLHYIKLIKCTGWAIFSMCKCEYNYQQEYPSIQVFNPNESWTFLILFLPFWLAWITTRKDNLKDKRFYHSLTVLLQAPIFSTFNFHLTPVCLSISRVVSISDILKRHRLCMHCVPFIFHKCCILLACSLRKHQK